MKKNKLLIGLFILFICLLSLTIYTSFSSNIDTQEIIIKSMIPAFDETSTIEVDNEKVIFNDKNQVVKYNVVLENTQDYDVKITDIKLSTPTEEFLQYKVEGISAEDEIKANSTKELVVSFETMGIKGWGRNFADELIANINFEKISKQEEVVPPVEETPKEEDKQPEAPATNIEEVINKAKKIEVNSITNNVIEFKDDIKVEEGKKVAVWIYSKPKFLGYFDVVITNGIKKIVGLEEAIKKAEITPGEHNIVLATEEKEVLGYVNVYINEEKEVLIEKPQDTTDKEEDKTAEDESKEEIDNKDESSSVNKPSGDKQEETKEDETGKVENPYTSDKELVGILGIATCITGVVIIIVSKNKLAKYTVFVLMLSPVLSTTNAEDPIELSINNNVFFESQNVMKPSGWEADDTGDLASMGVDYWSYAPQIKNFYIQNEVTEIEEYEYEFDVTDDNNGRVMAYLVERNDGSVCYNFEWEEDVCYDLYLQADGIIYPNEDASFYFYSMMLLDSINNLEGMDTSNVTDMSCMFQGTGAFSENFILDVSSFDTSSVTDMSYMFQRTGAFGENFILDVSNFDTSNVTDMSYMFNYAGSSSEICALDVSSFDLSNVVNMAYMFVGTCINANNRAVELTIKDQNMKANNVFGEAVIQDGTQIVINYTNKTKGIANRIVDSKSEGANIVLGEMVEIIEDDGELSIGDEVEINGEYFNVVSQTEDTVTLLAQYNLGTDYKQSSVQKGVRFSDTYGWEYTPGPKEIDIWEWSTNPKTYVNEYVEYLKEELNDDSVTGDLITLKDLEKLGCTVPSDYAYGDVGGDCYDSPYGWIANDHPWWTRSAYSTNSDTVWFVGDDGSLNLGKYSYDVDLGVRPVITISKEALEKLN